MKWIIILIAAMAFLAATNPESEDFVAYVHNNAEVGRYLGYESTLESDLRALGKDRTTRLTDKFTARQSYLFLSTYQIRVGPEQDRVRRKFIGVAGQFLQVGGPKKEAVPSSQP